MEDKELSLREIAQIIWNGRNFILKAGIIGATIAMLYSLFLPNWYKAKVVIMPPQSGGAALGAAGLLGEFGLGNLLGTSSDASRFIAILKSNRLRIELNKKYDFTSRYDLENLEETLKTLDKNLNVELGEENQIIVTFFDTEQDQVAQITNDIAFLLDSLNIAMFTNQAHNNRKFIEEQVQISLDSLKILENQIRDFMKQNGVLSLPEQVAASINTAAEIQAKIMSKEIELSIANQSLDPSNPQIARLKLEVKTLKNKYAQFFNGSNGNNLFPKFSDVPDLEIQYLQLKRKAEYYKKVLEFLGPQYEQAKIEEAKEIPTIQILDTAIRPEKKAKPRRSIITIVGFLFTSIIAAYWVYFKNRPNYPETTKA